jgi:hypothetical protein
MFNPKVVFGERAAVWSAGGVDCAEPRLRVLLPGLGPGVRDRARSAEFVPSIQHDRRRPRGRKGQESESRPFTAAVREPGTGARAPRHARRVALPGDPSDVDQAWTALAGHPGSGPVETERVQRLGLGPGLTEALAAVYDLQYWQRRVTVLPPGPELVAALADRPDELAPTSMAGSGPAAGGTDAVPSRWANAVLDSITARARVLSWLQAEQYTDLALLSRNYPGLAEMLPTEIGFALRTSDANAGAAISTARALAIRLPATLEALRAGAIDTDHAIGLARATGTTTIEVTAKVEADLLPLATAPGSTLTGEQLRRRAARRVITHDPDGARDRHRAAAADRYVSRWSEDDGMAGLRVLAPAQNIAVIWEALTGLADAGKFTGDTRTLGNRRVDALTNLCQDVLTGDVLFTAQSATYPTPECSTPPAPTATDRAPTDDTAPADHPAQGAAPAGATAPADQPTEVADEARPAADDADDADDADATVRLGAPDLTASEVADTGQKPSTATALDATITDGTARRDDAPGVVSAPTPASARPLPLPLRHGRRPHIQVVVPYTVFLGANDPCELVGHGAITADQARLIAADGELRRILTDPISGTVLDYGRTRYQPPMSLKQFIIARDGTCNAPGCSQPADRGQIDHIDNYRPGQLIGGSTCDDNLGAPCHHHHRAKDGGGFTATRDTGGATTWTTPLGRHYTRPPHQAWDADDHIDRAGRHPGGPASPADSLRPNDTHPYPPAGRDDPPPF